MEGDEAPRAAEAVVRARRLVRRYGDFVAVRGIDFDIWPGECFGFLGPNGAGKTTTIRMITCRIPPHGGSLSVFGLDVRQFPVEIKSRMGVVSQEDNLDYALSVEQNLEIYGLCFGLSRAEATRRAAELLELVDLAEKRKARPRELSGGMKRRLAIARALMNRPELVVLDEPTTGLDPHARALTWERLAQLKDQAVTLLLTTHYMEEAARLCDRIAIVDKGEIQAMGTPQELVERYVGSSAMEVRRWEGDFPGWLESQRVGDAISSPRNGALLRRVHRVGSAYYLYGHNLDVLMETLGASGVRLLDYRTREATLDDVFLELTGRGLENGSGEE